MSVYINKKDVIRINQEVGATGELQNESSLDFALSILKHRKSWLYEVAALTRSILVDHAFSDGNKRTALALILTYLSEKDMEYDKDKMVLAVYKIAKKNINDTNKIMRLIKNGIIR